MKFTYNGNGNGNGAATSGESSEAVDALEVYLRDISRIPALTPAEEAELGERVGSRRRKLRQTVFATKEALPALQKVLREVCDNPGSLDQRIRVPSGTARKEVVAALADQLREVDSAIEGGGAPRDAVADALAEVEFHMSWFRPVLENVLGTTNGASCRIREALALYQEAARELGSRHLGLVVQIAKRTQARGLPVSDLVQEGNTGLLLAVDRYSPEVGSFADYAKAPIQEAIRKYINDQSRLFRIPAALLKAIKKLTRFRLDYQDEHGRAPTLEEETRELRMTGDEIGLIDRLDRAPVSIDEPLDGEEMNFVGDLLEDTKLVSPLNDLERGLLQRRIDEMLQSLSVRERHVLRLRFGLCETRPHTVNEIAEKLRVSAGRVKKLQTNALRKLRESDNLAELEAFLEGIEFTA